MPSVEHSALDQPVFVFEGLNLMEPCFYCARPYWQRMGLSQMGFAISANRAANRAASHATNQSNIGQIARIRDRQ